MHIHHYWSVSTLWENVYKLDDHWLHIVRKLHGVQFSLIGALQLLWVHLSQTGLAMPVAACLLHGFTCFRSLIDHQNCRNWTPIRLHSIMNLEWSPVFTQAYNKASLGPIQAFNRDISLIYEAGKTLKALLWLQAQSKPHLPIMPSISPGVNTKFKMLFNLQTWSDSEQIYKLSQASWS